MSTDAQPAASSPAPGPSPDLATLSVEDRDHWRLTGEIRETPKPAPADVPEPDPSASPAESPPAEPVEQAASTDASPEAASEPATPKPSDTHPKTEARIRELLAERHQERTRREALERELADLRASRTTKEDVPPAPSPASAFPGYDTWAEAHPDGSYDDYMLAKFEHVQSIKQTEAQQRAATERIEAERSARVGAFLQRFDAAVSVNPALRERLNPAIVALKPVDALQPGEPVSPLNAVAQEILESSAPDKLLVHLSEHPEELEALSRLSPAGVIRRMAVLGAQLDTPAIPPPKTVSSAPAVTTTLGTRPAVPGDPVQSAIKSGDFSRYREAANAREIAALK